jgi:tol-pal system protein YbgF
MEDEVMRAQSSDMRFRRGFSRAAQHATRCAAQGMLFSTTVAIILAGTVTAANAQAPVSDPAKLTARLDQLERSLSGSSLVQMHQTLQTLAREVRELRGEVEEQSHAMKKLERRQSDMFLDLDRRMQAVETSAAAPPAGAMPADTPPASVPTPAPPPDTQEQAIPPKPPAGLVAAVDPAEEQKAYRAAFELLKGGKFAEASTALTAFLGKYPNGNFADNAQYWLGEAHYVSREFGPALKAFEQLLVDYPDSPKRPHSMLKIGFIYDENGQNDQARKVLMQLTEKYPKSTAASLAAKRLKRLK